MSNAYPSAGGIANYLKKIYGKSALTASGALLMAFSMVINESLVARTFGSYTLQLFDVGDDSIWVPILGVLLLVVAFLINISGNNIIGKSSESFWKEKMVELGGDYLIWSNAPENPSYN